jgi:hypothetical protein
MERVKRALAGRHFMAMKRKLRNEEKDPLNNN